MRMGWVLPGAGGKRALGHSSFQQLSLSMPLVSSQPNDPTHSKRSWHPGIW